MGRRVLKTEVQTKLHLAHISCAEDLPGRIAVDVAIRIHEVHVIGSVVILPLEFQGFGFGDLENFAERQVELIETGAAKRIVVNQALSSDRLRIDKCGRIEPMKSVLI